MDFKDMAIKMLMEKVGGASDSDTSASALTELFGGNGKLDISDIIGKFTGAGDDIGNKTKSWLGDGENDSISASQLKDVMGEDKINDFAAKLGIDSDEASGGLAELLPELIDKSSRGGSLLDSLTGSGGLAGLASRFLK